jgi:nanoRNase/pAp phosphatase (c-di-AMP/oligoRNAs hydrolase)
MAAHLGPVESPDLVSQIADFLLTYKGVRKVVCTGRYKGKLHVSLRVANPVADASEMLRDVFIHPGKAGGHGNIAGGSFEVGPRGPLAMDHPAWKEAEEALIQRLLKRFRLPAKGEFHYPFR